MKPSLKRRIRAAWFALLGRPLVFNVTVQYEVAHPPTFLIRGAPCSVDGLCMEPQAEGWKQQAMVVSEHNLAWAGFCEPTESGHIGFALRRVPPQFPGY